MALYDLNRSNDTPITTLKVSDIVPKNWHRFPPRVSSMTDANPNDAKPRYNSPANVAADWVQGAVGDDVDTATASLAVARSDGKANEPNYTPRNQAGRATQLGTTLAADIARARGPVAPNQPYPKAGDPPLAPPVITSLSPNTAAVGSEELIVTITGTGFSRWSTVLSGNYPIPSKYHSPTEIAIYQNPKVAVAGTVQVVVIDHNVKSAPSNFVFT